MPIGNLMMEATGTWSTVLYTVAGMDLFAAFLAIVALRPMLKAHVAQTKLPPPEPPRAPMNGLATAG